MLSFHQSINRGIQLRMRFHPRKSHVCSISRVTALHAHKQLISMFQLIHSFRGERFPSATTSPDSRGVRKGGKKVQLLQRQGNLLTSTHFLLFYWIFWVCTSWAKLNSYWQSAYTAKSRAVALSTLQKDWYHLVFCLFYILTVMYWSW